LQAQHSNASMPTQHALTRNAQPGAQVDNGGGGLVGVSQDGGGDLRVTATRWRNTLDCDMQ